MFRHNLALYPLASRIASALLLVLVCALSIKTHPAQAGNGPTIEIPASNNTITMDGVCSPSEYSSATQVIVTVAGTSVTYQFPIFMIHTTDDAYFCFGDAAGLPLPNGSESQVAIYIDRDDDGPGNDSDDFGVWMPYASGGSPWASYWGGTNYTVPITDGWQAVKHQTSNPDFWQVEFRISSQLLGGWKHTVGLALFYHWWRWVSDDFSWPRNGIWGAPQGWGNARFTTGNVNIGYSPSVPNMDGTCNSGLGSEYSDASTVEFPIVVDGTLVITTTTYLEHSTTDLYVCLSDLIIPAPGLQDGPNAALYLDRAGTGGASPGADDLLFTISYNGTAQANSWNGSDFIGPDPNPGGWDIQGADQGGVWDAEFRINKTTVERWWSRPLGLTVAERDVFNPGDLFAWPDGFDPFIPYTWGRGILLQLGSHNYLSVIAR